MKTPWESRPAWSLLRPTKRQGYADEQLLSVYREHGVVPKDSRDDNHNRAGLDLDAYQLVEPGNVVMNKMKAWQGSVALSSHRGIVSPDYMVLEFEDQSVVKRYYHYLLRSRFMVAQYKKFAYGVRPSQWRLMYPEFRSLRLLAPPLPSQRAIADLLDRKTTATDALIEKKRRLIALLEEKRAAITHRFVTKSSNHNVVMRASGLSWIGEIPNHWEIVQLRHIASSMQTGPFGSQLGASDYVDNEIPVINPANISDGRLQPDPHKTVDISTSKRLARHRVTPGDLLFARRGALGRCGLVTDEEDGWLCGTGCLRVRLDQRRITPSYLLAFTTLAGVAEWLEEQSVGSTMDNLNTSILGRLPVLLPPIPEQIDVCRQLESAHSRIYAALEKLQTQLSRLTEYRQSLITAAVTGQLPIEATP